MDVFIGYALYIVEGAGHVFKSGESLIVEVSVDLLRGIAGIDCEDCEIFLGIEELPKYLKRINT